MVVGRWMILGAIQKSPVFKVEGGCYLAKIVVCAIESSPVVKSSKYFLFFLDHFLGSGPWRRTSFRHLESDREIRDIDGK